MDRALIGVPLLVRHFSKTSFIKNNLFLNKEGFLLTKEQMPYSCAFTVFAGIGVAFTVAELFLPKGYSNFFTNFILSVCLFSVISLYFIFKNCPISILFNYKFLQHLQQRSAGQAGISKSRFSSLSRSSRHSSSSDYYTNPAYGGLSSNIYNKYR